MIRTDSQEARRSFQARTENIGAARNWVENVLADQGCSQVSEDAILLVSELCSNAVLYARTEFEVIVRCLEGSVRVEVRDGDPRLPTPEPLRLDAASGRGLAIVDAVSDNWNIEALDDGKRVWFELITV